MKIGKIEVLGLDRKCEFHRDIRWMIIDRIERHELKSCLPGTPYTNRVGTNESFWFEVGCDKNLVYRFKIVDEFTLKLEKIELL